VPALNKDVAALRVVFDGGREEEERVGAAPRGRSSCPARPNAAGIVPAPGHPAHHRPRASCPRRSCRWRPVGPAGRPAGPARSRGPARSLAARPPRRRGARPLAGPLRGPAPLAESFAWYFISARVFLRNDTGHFLGVFRSFSGFLACVLVVNFGIISGVRPDRPSGK
jgi:hypothetical protein